MELERETIIKVRTTDGNEVKKGDVVIFTTKDKCLFGKFVGLSARSNFIFKSLIGDFEYIVNPKTIKELYLYMPKAEG